MHQFTTALVTFLASCSYAAPRLVNSDTSTVLSDADTILPSTLATGPGNTLQKGYYWVRAVTSPNYHKYMQSKPLYSASAAVLGDYTTAAQLAIDNGQLTQLISGAGETPAKVLYAVVSETRSINNLSLAVSWSETKNTYGTFKWGGDDLQWSVAGVSRPNLSAWYVCTGQEMFINLGNYLYQTPSGCADQTIHYYNDAHANN